jgi:hypothetical protein
MTTWTGQYSTPIAINLVNYLKTIIHNQQEKYQMVSLATLEKNGWIVKHGELLGEPSSSP